MIEKITSGRNLSMMEAWASLAITLTTPKNMACGEELDVAQQLQ